jgi:Tfp pilus assembly protein PilZ
MPMDIVRVPLDDGGWADLPKKIAFSERMKIATCLRTGESLTLKATPFLTSDEWHVYSSGGILVKTKAIFEEGDDIVLTKSKKVRVNEKSG